MSITLRFRSQLRAARAMLNWRQETLAERSGVSLPTIKRLEPGDGPLRIRLDTLEKLQRAFELAGVEFTNGGQPGVRLAQSSINRTVSPIAPKAAR